MSKSPKISIGYYEELKRQDENISASKIINQALDIKSNLRSNTPEKENERNELAFEIVHNTKETARNTFLSNLNSRKVDKLIKQFTINVDECNDNAQKNLNKILDDITKCKHSIEIHKKKNEMLIEQLAEINNSCKNIENELRNKNEDINKLQIKFEKFTQIKPIFEELIRSFPDEEPKDLITGIKNSIDPNVKKIYQIDNLNDKLDLLEKDELTEKEKMTKTENELLGKINEIKMDVTAKTEKYKKEIDELEEELKIFQNYQKENVRIRNLLYNLFLDIITKIPKEKYNSFVKDYGKDPSKKEIFDAEVFNNHKFVVLLQNTILKNPTKSRGSLLLRQTIAYSNMMIRKYFEKKDSYRYDPVTTFRELKNLFDKKQFDLYKLGCLIQNLKTNQHNNKQIIAELKNELKMSKLKFLSLKKKAERQFRVEKVSNQGRKRHFSARTKFKKKQLPLLNNNMRPSTSMDPKKKFFITTTNKKYNKNENNKNDNVKEEETKDIKSIDEESSDNEESDFSSNEEEEESKEESSNLVLEDESVDQKEIKRFRDLKISKNRDKLIRSNGFKGMDNIISGLKNLADRTNRILYYKTQTNFSEKKTSDSLNNKKDTLSSSNFNSLRDKKIDEHEKIYNKLSQDVMSKLNKMITEVKK